MASEAAKAHQPLPPEVRIELSRDLTTFDITMIGVGAMIGAGIFVLMGSTARVAGPATILVFLLNGLATMPTAFTYMELGSAYPEAGGGYLWAKDSLPPPSGFLSGWFSWMAHIIACALYAAAFAAFVHLTAEFYGVAEVIFPGEFHFAGLVFRPLEKLITVLVIASFVAINQRGVHQTGRTETYITLGKVVILGIFIAFAANMILLDPRAIDRYLGEFIPRETGLWGIVLGMGLTFIAFEGYEIITQSGEEVKNPDRAIPRAILISIILVVFLYVMTFVAALGVTRIDMVECFSPADAWECLGSVDEPELAMIRAAQTLLGGPGLVMMVIGGVLATTSALNATVYSSSRVGFAMGRDGSLPRMLGEVHPERRTPANSIFVSGVIITFFAVFLPIETIAVSADVLFLLLFMLANASHIALRVKKPDLIRGYTAPLFPYMQIIGIGTKGFLAVALWYFPGREVGGLGPGEVAWYVALLWIAIGLIYHYFSGGRREIEEAPRPRRREILEVIAAKARGPAAGPRVLLPLRDPTNLQAVRVAALLARDRGAELVLIHVVEVPMTLPPKSVRFSYVDERIKSLGPAQATAHELGVEVSTVVKIAHKVYETILDTVEEEADLLILGWRGERPARGGRVLGTNIDFLLQRARCDVVVMKTVGMKETLERITLLAGRGSHVRHAAKVAALVALDHGAQVDVLSVVTQKEEEEAIETAHRLIEILDEHGVPHEHKLVYSGSVVKACTSEARSTDLLVMGASPVWALRKYAFGPLEDRIAKRVTCPVLMVRKGRPRPPAEEPTPEGTGA